MNFVSVIISAVLVFCFIDTTSAIIGEDCENGPPLFHGCNICRCLDGFLTKCTKYGCDPSKSFYVVCVEKEIKIDNCQVVRCQNETWKYAGQVCTPDPNLIGKPDNVTRSVRDLSCFEGDKKGKCDECVCVKGQWQCSETDCSSRKNRAVDDEENEEGATSFLGKPSLSNLPPPCERLDQFTIQCNSSRVYSFPERHRFRNIPPAP